MTAIPNMDDTSIDAPVAWHYGDPFREQRLLLDGTAQIDLSHYGVVLVSGEDRLSWLHSLTSQDFLSEFVSLQALILSPQGHLEHDLHAIEDGTQTWLIVEPGTSNALTKYLTMMKFMLRVDVQDVSADFAVIGSSGWVDSEYPTWHSPIAFAIPGNVTDIYVANRPDTWQVSQIIVPRLQLDEVLNSKPVVGTWAWDAHRIRAGVPRLGFESDTRTIPHELGLIAAAVHLNKGCYRGQETVAKVYNLGKPPRRLVQLQIDGSTNDLPGIGSPVTWNEKEIGRLTSIIQDFENGPLGLAVIKRSVDVDAQLLVGSIAASQTPIVQ